MADATDTTVIRTFKYRLLPSRKQHEALRHILEEQRILYNSALQERIDCYRKTGKGRTYYDQCKALTELRQEPEYARIPVKIQRGTLARLDEAFNGFFRRLKAGEKAGFPRFKGRAWFTSFEFAEFSGVTFEGKRIRFKGLPGGLRVYMHRPMPEGKPLSCKFKLDHKGWSVSFQMRVPVVAMPSTGQSVGVDVGLSSLAVLSTGEAIPNPQVARRAEREMRRRQRALARCKRGSKRRAKVKAAVTRCHAKIANTRRTHLHQVSARLVRENDTIVIEDLNVKGLAGGMLAKPVHDAGWSTLRQMLTYKAESAGRKLIAVDPRHTSQTCPECGRVAKKRLSQRTHKCDCGCVLDRDHAAALVILKRGGSASRVPQDKAA